MSVVCLSRIVDKLLARACAKRRASFIALSSTITPSAAAQGADFPRRPRPLARAVRLRFPRNPQGGPRVGRPHDRRAVDALERVADPAREAREGAGHLDGADAERLSSASSSRAESYVDGVYQEGRGARWRTERCCRRRRSTWEGRVRQSDERVERVSGYCLLQSNCAFLHLLCYVACCCCFSLCSSPLSLEISDTRPERKTRGFWSTRLPIPGLVLPDSESAAGRD